MIPKASWKSVLVFPPLYQWNGFLLATLCVVLGAASFDYLSASGGQSSGLRALASLQRAAELMVGALLCALVLWICVRFIKGASVAPEPKESVLWSASVIVILVTAIKMLQ